MDLDLEEYYQNPHLTLFQKQKDMVKEALLKQFFLVDGEPGSGKTVITVYLLKILLLKKLISNVFILTKNEVLYKYKEELLMHLPFLKDSDVKVMEGNKDRDFFDNDAVIYICDYFQAKLIYSNFTGKIPAKNKRKRFMVKKVFPITDKWAVIFDEIQSLKNIRSDVHKILYRNTTDALCKIATSGTPIEKIEELYAVFRLLSENIIRMNYNSFMQSIAKLDEGSYRILYYRESGIKSVKNRINPYMKSLKKEDISEVVPKNIINLEASFNSDFRLEYDHEVKTLKDSILSRGGIPSKEIATIIQPLYNKVKEISDYNPRFEKFHNLILRLYRTEKVVVWERNPEIIKGLSEYYSNLGIKNICIYGDIPKHTRASVIKKFNEDPEIRILFNSFLVSAEAWEIPSRKDCKRMIFYSLPDRIISFLQCVDRLHRLNSKEPVFIYKLLLRESIDDWALDLLDYKQKIRDGLMKTEDFKSIERDSCSKFLGIDKKYIA